MTERCRFPSVVFWMLLIGVVLAAGCNDAARETATYRAILDQGHPLTMPSYDPAAPLPLVDALRRADLDNETIASRGEDYIQALASKERDAGTFLPTLSLDPTYSLAHGGTSGFVIGGTGTGTGLSGTGSGGTGGGTSTGGSGSTGGTGSVQITGGGQGRVSHGFSLPVAATYTGSLSNISTYEAAGKTAEQDAQLLLDEQETILLSVVTSYYTVLKAEHQIEVFESSLRFKAEKVRDQQARLRLGAVRPLDLAQSESDLAATRVSLTQARATAMDGRSALARLLSVSSCDGPLTDAYALPATLPDLPFWQQTAVQHRQDLIAADRAVEAARLKVESAVREYFPSVTLNFDYFMYNDPKSGQLWSAGLTGNIPIFSALSIEADVRTAWSAYRQAGLTRRLTRRQVMDDINEDFQNFASAKEQVEELTVEVQAAQKAFDLAERSYALGSESNLDRLTQQDNLLTAQLNLISEQFDEKSSYLTLLRATGTLASAMR